MIIDIIKSCIENTWPSLVIIVVLFITVRFAYLRNHRSKVLFHEEFWTLISILYLILLYDLVTNTDLNSTSGMNITPFTEMFRYKIGSKLFYFNVIGNIAVFVPFGFIIGQYARPKKAWTNILIGIIISTTIEFIQLYIGRSFDIDDIILNTVGCLIGYLIYIGLRAILNHLPKFLQSDWFNNIICIIISCCIAIYLMQIMGVLS